jgi:hypothetical protein
MEALVQFKVNSFGIFGEQIGIFKVLLANTLAFPLSIISPASIISPDNFISSI